MKKIYVQFVMVILLIWPSLAYGQSDNNPVSIHIKGVETNISGDSLRVDFHIRVKGIRLTTYQRLKLELAVRSDEKQAFLPAIIYTGKVRLKYDNRNRLLSSHYRSEQPYRVYTGIQENREYQLAYRINIPYARWMDHASLLLRQTFETNGLAYVNEQLLTEDLYPEHRNEE